MTKQEKIKKHITRIEKKLLENYQYYLENAKPSVMPNFKINLKDNFEYLRDLVDNVYGENDMYEEEDEK